MTKYTKMETKNCILSEKEREMQENEIKNKKI